MSDPWQKPEVGFELQFVKIQIGRLQETILEVVEVEEYTVYIKFWLRIAVLPIQSSCTANLDIRKFTNGFLKEFLLFLIVTSARISSALDGIEKRSTAKVCLKIAEFIIAHRQNLGNRQLSELEMLSQIYKGMILITTGSYHTNYRITIMPNDTEILPVTPLPCQFYDISRFFTRPFLYRSISFSIIIQFTSFPIIINLLCEVISDKEKQ